VAGNPTPQALCTAARGTCSYRYSSPSRQTAVAEALTHRAKYPSHVVTVKDATGRTLAERFLSE
jgi:hypothetical protein